MCLVLLHINSNGLVTIAANRDEWFHRPTASAECYTFYKDSTSAKAEYVIPSSGDGNSTGDHKGHFGDSIGRCSSNGDGAGSLFIRVDSGLRNGSAVKEDGPYEWNIEEQHPYPYAQIEDLSDYFSKSIPTSEPLLDDGRSGVFQVVGSRDMQLGNDQMTPLNGSPFLVSSNGRWAVITNATRQVCSLSHDSVKQPSQLLSRGHIVTSFVCSSIDPLSFVKEFDEQRRGFDFDGFNLIFGVGEEVYFLSNRVPDIDGKYYGYEHVMTERVSPTFKSAFYMKLEKERCYGVSNSFLDAPEPRIIRAKESVIKEMDLFCISMKCVNDLPRFVV